MRATLERVEELSPRIKTFWFRPERRARYIAGQFIEVTLPDSDHDTRGARRWFTLSSSPTEPLLGVTTTFTTTNGSSFKRALARLPIGAKIMLSEPMGDFVLPKDTTIPLIFVAAGIGITPIRSMTTWLIDIGERRDITLFYQAKNTAAMPFLDLCRSYYSNKLHTIQGRHLTSQDILPNVLVRSDSLIYLAGPEALVQNLRQQLGQAGIAAQRIVTDLFLGYTN